MSKFKIYTIIKENLFVLTILVFIFILFIYINVIYPIIPLNSDEAWNYFRFARFGPIYSIFNYDADNFHIFFTMLQSITVPWFLLQKFPEAIRLANTAIGVLFFFFLFQIGSKFVGKKLLFLIFTGFCCYFVSPIATPYFIMARGYLLGMLFLLMGIYFLISKRFFLAPLFFILSGWSVPTYTYTFPLIYLFIFTKEKQREQIISSFVIMLLGLVICYLPAIKRLSEISNVYGINSLPEFLKTSFTSFSNLSFLQFGNVLNTVFVFSYFLSLTTLLKEKINQRVKNFSLLLAFSILSYFLVVIILSLVRHMNEPFLRNGLFVPIFACITISLAIFLTKNKSIRLFLIFLMLLNAFAGLYFLTINFVYKDASYPMFQGEQKYEFNDLLVKIKNKRDFNIPLKLKNAPLVFYYLYLYSSPVSNQKHTIVSKEAIIFPNLHISKSIRQREELRPTILPTNKLYFVKKIAQSSFLKIFDLTYLFKGLSMNYLLYLSDNTYSEADILWNQGKYAIALETAAKAENYMTVLANDSKGHKIDQKVYLEIEKSILLHESILKKMHNLEGAQTLSAIVYFYRDNYNRLKALSL